MAKTIWQRIKQNHLLLMGLCCLVPIVLIIGFLGFFKGSSYWVWLIILLCPILHFWMMRKHGSEERLYQCPECGFWYKEKEWAEKCETWCKEHKSCNLEITKYALNPPTNWWEDKGRIN